MANALRGDTHRLPTGGRRDERIQPTTQLIVILYVGIGVLALSVTKEGIGVLGTFEIYPPRITQ